MEMRTALIVGFIGLSGLSATLLAGMLAMSSASKVAQVVLIAGIVIGIIGFLIVLIAIPKENPIVSGGGPKNLNTGINNGIVGDVTGNVQFGKLPTIFTAAMGEAAIARCVPGLPVRVRAVGTERSVPLAQSLAGELTKRGFKVMMDRVYSKIPAPTQPITVENTPTETIITIYPNL